VTSTADPWRRACVELLKEVALSPEVVAAQAAAVAALIIDQVLTAADRSKVLLPLDEILSISKKGALMRARRDPALARLGVRIGRSLRFSRAAVEAYYASTGGRTDA